MLRLMPSIHVLLLLFASTGAHAQQAFELASGPEVVFHSMNGARAGAFEIRAVFDQGVAHGHMSNANPDFAWSETPYFRLRDPLGVEHFADGSTQRPGPDGAARAAAISWQRVAGQGVYANLGHSAIVRDFVEAVGQGREPNATFEDGYRDTLVLEAMLCSIEQKGARVAVQV